MPAPKRGRSGRRKVTGDKHARYRGLLVRTIIDGAAPLTPEERKEFDALATLPVRERVCTSPSCAGSCGWSFMPNAAKPRPIDD